MQDGRKTVWSIPCVSVAFFPSLKQNFIVYRSSRVSSHPDCIFEIHQLWQSGFSRVYSNSCCSCSFEAEILEIGQSFHKMYSNNILNFQESTTILNTCTKKSRNLLKAPRRSYYIYICLCVFIHVYKYVSSYIYIYICTRMILYQCVSKYKRTSTHTHTYMYIYVYECVYLYVCVYVSVCVWVPFYSLV